jgi:hypothetical protein
VEHRHAPIYVQADCALRRSQPKWSTCTMHYHSERSVDYV